MCQISSKPIQPFFRNGITNIQTFRFELLVGLVGLVYNSVLKSLNATIISLFLGKEAICTFGFPEYVEQLLRWFKGIIQTRKEVPDISGKTIFIFIVSSKAYALRRMLPLLIMGDLVSQLNLRLNNLCLTSQFFILGIGN